MIFYKSFKFRVYPDKSHVERLAKWESSLRFLWNLAHEQRLSGLSRLSEDKIFVTLNSQSRELTELRRQCPWLKDVPRHLSAEVLQNLDKAWQQCFNKTAYRPGWKKKSNQSSFTESDPIQWSIRGTRLKFPKLAPMKIVLHRPLEGKPKSCNLKKYGDQWFASIVCEVEILDPVPRTDPKIGLDRGITNFIGTSNRELVPNPKFLEKGLKRLARASRNVASKVKGSKNREKAKNRVSRIHRKIRRQRDHFLHVLSSKITKSHGVVVLENLNVAGMARSSLARHIAGASWSRFAQFLSYKQEWTGGTVVEVEASYTSQTCYACKHVDSSSRSGEKFHCTRCGHTDHADLNAPLNILDRASRSVQPAEGSCHKTPRRSRKVETQTTVVGLE